MKYSLRNLPLLTSVLSFLASIAVCDEPAKPGVVGWSEVKSEVGNFRISFPGKVETSTSTIDTGSGKVVTHKYASASDEGKTRCFAYFGAVNEDVAKSKTPEQALDAACAGAFKPFGRPKEVKETKLTLGKYLGRQLEAETKHEGFVVFLSARYYVIKNRLHAIILLSFDKPLEDTVKKKIFDSFAIIRDE